MFPRVKGTNDFFPSDFAALAKIIGQLSLACQKYGFNQVMAPSIETVKLLTAKSGEETKSQMFLLEKKSSEENALKYDLTVPMTRMFVSKQRELAKPVKWFSVDRMWRYEAPQQGREREFFQISVESFGSDKPEADAEIINLFIDCLLSTGLKDKEFVLKVNHRKLLEGILQDIVPKGKTEAAMRIIDKSAKLEEQQFFAEMAKAGIDNTRAARIKHATDINGTLDEVDKKIAKHLELNELALEGWKNLKAALSMVKHKNVHVDLSIARGLAYYTGCVFEAFDTEGVFRALGAGGRYDQLVQLLGGEACPATGFAIGYSTLSLLLQHHKRFPQAALGPDYSIVPLNEDMLPEALKLAHELRKNYTVDIDIMRRKIGKQFDYANGIGAKKVIVLGPEEIKSKKFTVKDMKTGKEEKKKLAEL
jgi:histidyl-tRNA synthetase